MKKILLAIVLLNLSISLSAKDIDITKSKGTNQEVITSLSPEPMDDTVKRGTNIKITFDKKLKTKHLQNSIKLKYLGCQQEKKAKLRQKRNKNIQRCNSRFKNNKNLIKSCRQCVKEIYRCQKQRKCKPKNIRGNTKYLKNRDTLKFNPHNRLRPGYYQVTAKGLKTEDNKKIKNIMYRFEVSKNSIESITLSQNDINLKEQESTKLTLQAIYKDGTTEDITKDINWIIGDSTLVSIDADGNLKALKAGETLVQAEYHGKVSEEIKVTITKKAEIINGYVLPPEPDEAVNNSTLLGLDSNDNGVRDDVERYVIKRFALDPEFPKTKTAIAMQYAWASQKILENPILESSKYEDDVISCQFYWLELKTKDMSTLDTFKYFQKQEVFGDVNIKDKLYNTKTRIKQKFEYNRALSGNIFSGQDNTVGNCQVNILELGE